MAKLSLALTAALAASASAFAPQQATRSSTSLKASDVWDPMGLYELGTGEAFDTFPNMFPNKQFLDDSEKKHGRMAMLAWTGVWATTQVSDFCWPFLLVDYSTCLQSLRESQWRVSDLCILCAT